MFRCTAASSAATLDANDTRRESEKEKNETAPHLVYITSVADYLGRSKVKWE